MFDRLPSAKMHGHALISLNPRQEIPQPAKKQKVCRAHQEIIFLVGAGPSPASLNRMPSPIFGEGRAGTEKTLHLFLNIIDNDIRDLYICACQQRQVISDIKDY